MRHIAIWLLLLYSIASYAQKDIAPTDRFTVSGLVSNRMTVSIADLEKYHQDDLGEVAMKNNRGEVKRKVTGVKGILLKAFIDSAGIKVDKPKEYSALYIVLTASDGYKNVYSWSELYNSDIGDHVYVITAMDGNTLAQMPDRIAVMQVGDKGMRHLKALKNIEVRKAE
jgi:DMSO/TMAO reductase YedYZ molybdopterin-dependent catalytic subunit